LKILLVHNSYQQRGGEDIVVAAERELLQSQGHEVRFHGVSNDAIRGIFKKIKTAWQAPYSLSSRAHIAGEISSFRPDIVHVHNFFPLLTPSIYDACLEACVPVVQTLHNFRMICPGALLSRNDMICEECIRGNTYRAAVYRCYRRSFLGSLAAGRMVAYHRRHDTWRKKVDCFIALTDFARDKFVQAGFSADKVAVKPNFLNYEPAPGKGEGGYALFVGRLSHEKGVKLLLDAWKLLSGKMPLKIAGDGPLAGWVSRETKRMPSVQWLGYRERPEVVALMRDASVLVFPSTWFETFGMSIIEAYSVGLPVIAGDLGAMSLLVAHGRTGLLFRPGDARDLAAQVQWAVSHPAELARMRREARAEFEMKYTARISYGLLMNIYGKSIAANTRRVHERSDRPGGDGTRSQIGGRPKQRGKIGR
jgi:glycosyltransferase involved in cell wall biosynthesis